MKERKVLERFKKECRMETYNKQEDGSVNDSWAEQLNHITPVKSVCVGPVIIGMDFSNKFIGGGHRDWGGFFFKKSVLFLVIFH